MRWINAIYATKLKIKEKELNKATNFKGLVSTSHKLEDRYKRKQRQ